MQRKNAVRGLAPTSLSPAHPYASCSGPTIACFTFTLSGLARLVLTSPTPPPTPAPPPCHERAGDQHGQRRRGRRRLGLPRASRGGRQGRAAADPLRLRAGARQGRPGAPPLTLISLSPRTPLTLISLTPHPGKKKTTTHSPLARAGQTVTAFLYPALTDFAVADADGERAALPGRYTVRFGLQKAATHGMGFAEIGDVAGPLAASRRQSSRRA